MATCRSSFFRPSRILHRAGALERLTPTRGDLFRSTGLRWPWQQDIEHTGRSDADQTRMGGEGKKKLYSSTIAVDNARDATQVFGGYGFMNEYAVARHWRDAKILEIGEGTSEVQRMLIARQLGLK